MRLTVIAAAFVLGAALALHGQPAPDLRIVVLEGEGAVNIIQQKTAVRALVEVRDRNNLPAAGATVTFALSGQGGAGAAQTITVTTNAAGQAALTGATPTTSGTLQISVNASFKGLSAAATITQSVVATVAAATAATAGGIAAGAATGGGLSTGAIVGIVGGVAAVGGGAVIATQAAGGGDGDDNDGDGGGGGGGGAQRESFVGPLVGQVVLNTQAQSSQGPGSNCSRTMRVGGALTILLDAGRATGVVRGQVDQTETSFTGNCFASSQPTTFSLIDVAVTGGPSTLTFSHTAQVGVTSNRVSFTGAVNGNTISGTFSLDVTFSGSLSGGGATSFQVTLQK